MCKKRNINLYTESGRAEIHDNLRVKNQWIMSHMAERPIRGRTVEYNDNRISLFAAQYGRCAITGEEFLSPDEVHCHHKKPLYMGGKDNYQNLTLVLQPVHILIHAKTTETIKHYLSMLNLNSEQKKKLNKLRQMAGCEPV